MPRLLFVLLLAATATAAIAQEAAPQPSDAPTEPLFAEAALIQPKLDTGGSSGPVAQVLVNGVAGTTFNLVAGTSITLDGSNSSWTYGWQRFR